MKDPKRRWRRSDPIRILRSTTILCRKQSQLLVGGGWVVPCIQHRTVLCNTIMRSMPANAAVIIRSLVILVLLRCQTEIPATQRSTDTLCQSELEVAVIFDAEWPGPNFLSEVNENCSAFYCCDDLDQVRGRGVAGRVYANMHRPNFLYQHWCRPSAIL